MIPMHPMAAYTLESSHDGEIPAALMAEARRIDAEFEAANPNWRALSQAKKDLAYMRNQFSGVVKAIRARNALTGRPALSDRQRGDLQYWRDGFHAALSEVRAASTQQAA